MQELPDTELLRQYAEQDSEAAFAALVERHVNLVHTAAMRRTGNPHAAEEITQAVFVILAKKARVLRKETILSGWLYQTARLTAANFLRSEIRRARREQEAYMQSLDDETGTWPQIEPILDDAMGRLSEKERNAIVLRFFEGKSFQEVGAAFGSSENAAKKRVIHGLEKLRRFFAKRGVSSTTAVIAGVISVNSVQAAPVPLAKSVTAVAIAKGVATGGSTLTLMKGVLKLMAWTKTQTAIVSVVIVSAAIYSVVQHQAQVKLREQNESLRQQVGQLPRLTVQNQNLSNLLTEADRSEALAEKRLSELLRQGEQKQGTEVNPGTTSLTDVPASSAATAEPNELPKNSWTNAGFATPQMALRTRGWAVLNGDRDLFKQSLFISDDARKFAEDALVQMAEASTDPNKAQYIQQVVNNKYGVEEAFLLPMMAANQNNTYTGYKILSQQLPSADEMILEVETDMASAPAQTENLDFQRFGNDWKIVINKQIMEKMMRQQ